MTTTTDFATLGLEQAYGKFPEARLRRIAGLNDAEIAALRTTWEQQTLGWRYEQGLAFAGAPDDWIAGQIGQWPPPTALPLTVYVGDAPPFDPPADALWWSKLTESMSRWDAATAEWVPESSTAAGSFVPLSVLSVAGGVATLDADGKLVTAQIPRFVIGETFVVADQPSMLALDAHIGDIAKRTDLGGAVYMLTEADPAALGNWLSMGATSGDVLSVNGQTGAIVLGPADVGTDAAGTARPPTAHATSHSAGGADPITPGAIGTDAAGTPRPPTAHKASHLPGGSDAISPSDIGALTRVVHGATAGVARPTGVVGPVAWYGTVAPTNAATNDVWQDQVANLWKRWSGTAWAPLATTTLPDSAITVDPSGLIVVQGSDTNVHSVIARLDAAILARISRVQDATDVDWASVTATTPMLGLNTGTGKIQGFAAPTSLSKQHIVGTDTALPAPAAAGGQGATVDIGNSSFTLTATPAGADQWVTLSGVLTQTGGVQPSPGSSVLSVVDIQLVETTGGTTTILLSVPIPLTQNSTVAVKNTLPIYLPFWLGAIASTRTFKWRGFTLSPGGGFASATVTGPSIDTFLR